MRNATVPKSRYEPREESEEPFRQHVSQGSQRVLRRDLLNVVLIRRLTQAVLPRPQILSPEQGRCPDWDDSMRDRTIS